MLRLIRHVRSFVLWTVWVVLAVIWVATLWRYWTEGYRTPVLLATLDLILLFILYFAEGIELAITDLLDKEPSQLREASVRSLLAEIQVRSGFFFAQRQVFVVVIIAVLSLTTAYTWIYVPFYGRVDSPTATFWFSLTFTSFTVLWFCQVTPKRLAIINSELFLKQSGLVWRLIKAISVLGLPDPSDLLVYTVQKNSDFSHGRYLLPGRAAHYDITTHLFGFALDALHTSIRIRSDGSATICKKFLILFLRGYHSQMYGSIATRSTFVEPPRVLVKALYVLAAHERIESISDKLDAIFSETGKVEGNMVQEWVGKTEVTIDESSISRIGQEALWSIEGQPLPESLWLPSASGIVTGSTSGLPMAALLYEVEAEVKAGGFDSSGDLDQWPETIGLPCRSYSISIKPTFSDSAETSDSLSDPKLAVVIEGCNVTLVGPGTEMSDETLRLTQSAVAGKGDLTVSYPLQGGCYTLSWRVFKR
jgi:hypothetical protein